MHAPCSRRLPAPMGAPVWSQFEVITLGAELAQSYEQFAPVEEGPRVRGAARCARRLIVWLTARFADESKLRSYALRPCAALIAEFSTFHDWRVRKLNRHRQGNARSATRSISYRTH